ncbi:hypothetical protein GGQ64_005364 [Rhizobium azooxidifex]|uniref:Uncharacterized protein n=1 Tax=Mycoplana azooxidifex TaxID=1636188 RepID=A0A7W6GM60_9HYPH|nr:hypothetical protein [Mycoplana azooxidifex]MBB3980117.1 hypothetical protein [Mycoplana azooxidifex]
MIKPTEAAQTPVIERVQRLIRDLEAGAILGYDGPQEYWTSRMGAEASAEVARLLTAALAVEAGTVGVKPLEWTEGVGLWTAQTQFVACYSVWEVDADKWRCSLLDGDFPTAYAAKAAAQEDYEACIRSALTTSPASSGVEVEAVATAKWVGEEGSFPKDAPVTILAVDNDDPDVPARRAAWVRYWPEGRDFPRYRSCDMCDLEVAAPSLSAGAGGEERG